jgi:phytoene/squalene synthetase
MLTWADRTMRDSAGGLWWMVRLLMPARGAATFIQTYSYFRWADDIVDAPDREPAVVRRFVQQQRALVEDALSGCPVVTAGPAEEALLQATRSRPGCPRLAASIRTMWAALAFDAGRDTAPITGPELAGQIQRVGDAYTQALLACLDIDTAPPGLWSLARAATAVHHLRDLILDAGLGYHNLPAEAARTHDIPLVPGSLSDAAPYVRERAVMISAQFDAGEHALRALGWRGRALFGALAWKYRRQLDRLLADLPAVTVPARVQVRRLA